MLLKVTTAASAGIMVLALFGNTAAAQSNTGRGAVAGGAAGAVIGGIIGHQNDETPEGALIGGALGALAGGMLGQQRDIDNYRGYQYQQQVQQQQAIAYQYGVSMRDVVSLSQSGVGPSVIINQINMNGVQQRIGVNEIIAMHQQGVDSTVIDAMQHAQLATTQARRLPATQQPVVIREPILVPRPIVVHDYHTPYHSGYHHSGWHSRPSHHHHHHAPRSTGFHIDIRR